MPVHIFLTVADVSRSLSFYREWMGFGAEDRRFSDGTVFVRDGEGTDLALREGPWAPLPADTFHFGFRRDSPEAVRELHARLVLAGVDILEFEDDARVVTVKVRDPDGYCVEVYWEAG